MRATTRLAIIFDTLLLEHRGHVHSYNICPVCLEAQTSLALVRALPDLLEAAEEMIRSRAAGDFGADGAHGWKLLAAAIAKAEGTS